MPPAAGSADVAGPGRRAFGRGQGMVRRLLIGNLILGAALLVVRLFFWPAQVVPVPKGLVEVAGHIDGRSVLVDAGSSGRVKRLAVSVGDCLVKGQVVAELEDGDLLVQDQSVRADLKASRERVRQAVTDLENLRRDGGIGEDLAAAQDALAQARAQAERVQQRVDRIETALFARQIVSPVSGAVASLSVAVGSPVEAGKPVASVVDYDSLHFTGGLSEAQGDQLRVGLPGDIRLADLPQHLFPAAVVSLVTGGDQPERVRVSLTFLGEIHSCLLPGQAASALILAE